MVDPTMTRPRPVSVPAGSPWELPSPYGAHPYRLRTPPNQHPNKRSRFVTAINHLSERNHSVKGFIASSSDV